MSARQLVRYSVIYNLMMDAILTSTSDLALEQARLGRRRLLVISMAPLLVLLIGCVDMVTGWELSLFVFYALPILMVVWQDKRQLAVIIAVLCGVVWWLANIKDFPYRSEWSYHWASMGRTVYFVLVALGGNAFRARQKSDLAMIEALNHTSQLEREIVQASEHEQQRIGLDLHDGLCQQLAAIGFAARSLADDLQSRSLPEAKLAEKIEELLRDCVTQTQGLARGIFPVLSRESGLATALDELAIMTKHLTHINVWFRDDGEVHLDQLDTAMHLYRIAQEALNNALRHSGGSEVIISLQREGENVRLTIVDDGIGIPENLGLRTGIGLSTMSYRARVIGATLEIERRSPHGTRVSCVYRPNRTPNHDNTL